MQVQALGSPRAEGVYHRIEPRQVAASERENVLDERVLRLGGVFGPHDSGNFMPRSTASRTTRVPDLPFAPMTAIFMFPPR